MQLTLNIPYKNKQWQAHYECKLDNVKALGIKGRSGSGKTTLMRIIAGLENVTEGELYVNNQHWLSQNKLVKPQSRNIAYVTQDSLLFPHLSIGKNLLLASKKGKLSLNEQNELVSSTGINLWLSKKPRELSGGQRQRVSLVQALMQTPKLLLCDEPLSALDTQSRKHLIKILKDFIKLHQIPMIYISHNDKEIRDLTDHCLVIENGKIVANDETENIISKPVLPLCKSKDEAVENQLKTSLSFKTITWHKQDRAMELNLIEGNKHKTPTKITKLPLLKPLFVSTPFPLKGTTWHTSLSPTDVVLSRSDTGQLNEVTSFENSLNGTLVELIENTCDFTACIDVSGNIFYSSLSKRLSKKLALTRGEILTIYFSLRYEKGDNH